MKKKTKKITTTKYGGTLDENMPDFSKHPYFVKQHAAAKESYLRCPLPPEMVEKILKQIENK